jgi:hypothetical protein
MPDTKGNLYLFEALELRKEYDRHIKMLEDVLGIRESKRDRLFSARDEEEMEPAAGFDPEKMEAALKKLQTKRVKLNQAVQKANFENPVQFAGEEISLAEALEVRKNLLADQEALGRRVSEAAYKRIIHKEGRDIVREPRQQFAESHASFLFNLRNIRQLMAHIHHANHTVTVAYKNEPGPSKDA